MDEKGYIAKIRDFEFRKSKLSTSALHVLHLFVQKESVSISEIHKTIKPPYKMAYTTVGKKFKLFKSLGLIEFAGKKKTGLRKRNTLKLYRLTLKGIYFILKWYSRDIYLMADAKLLFEKYSGDKLFTTFVYPYISRETLSSLEAEDIHIELLSYLHNCCLEIESYLDSINKYGPDSIVEAYWIDGNTGTHKLLDFLYKEVSYRGISHTIKKDEFRKTAHIKASENDFSLRYNDKTKKVVLSTYSKKGIQQKTKTYTQDKIGFKFEEIPETVTREMFQLQRFETTRAGFFNDSVFRIISYFGMRISDKDLRILCLEDKFMLAAYDIFTKFYDTYHKLDTLRKRIR